MYIYSLVKPHSHDNGKTNSSLSFSLIITSILKGCEKSHSNHCDNIKKITYRNNCKLFIILASIQWIRINRGLNKLVNRCIEEERILWVIGY